LPRQEALARLSRAPRGVVPAFAAGAPSGAARGDRRRAQRAAAVTRGRRHHQPLTCTPLAVTVTCVLPIVITSPLTVMLGLDAPTDTTWRSTVEPPVNCGTRRSWCLSSLAWK